jgi:hypothetical protein
MPSEQTTDCMSDVTEALARFDAAMRDYLRDCWMGCESVAEADARYQAAQDARIELDRAISRYTSRHAREFEAAKEERDG